MSVHSALLNNDILVSILRQFSLIDRPLTIESRKYHEYWSPYRATSPGSTLYTNITTLRNVALTCKAFCDPALDELWAAPIGGLYTVLGLLSAFQCRIERQYTMARFGPPNAYDYRYYELNGDIDPLEWEILLRYAARVRMLGHHRFSFVYFPYTIVNPAFPVLLEKTAGLALFPNLLSLEWESHEQDYTQDGGDVALRLLAAPSLSVIITWHPTFERRGATYQYFEGPSPGNKDDLATIADRCPAAQHIRLELLYGSPNLVRLAACLRLRSFSCGSYLHFPHVIEFARLPDLRDLEIGGLTRNEDGNSYEDPLRAGFVTSGYIEVPEEWHSLMPPDAFPALGRATVGKSEPALVQLLINAISSRTLASLSLNIQEVTEDQKDMLVCTRSLASLASLRTLSLEMRFRSPKSGDGILMVQFVDIAGPLLVLRHLQTVNLRIVTRKLCMSDRDVRQMAETWPELTVLKIINETPAWVYYEPRRRRRYPHAYAEEPTESADPHARNVVRPSIHAAVDLAQRCTKLSELTLDVADISASDVEALKEHAESAGMAPQSALTKLLPCSYIPRGEVFKIEEVPTLVLALRKMFPRLTVQSFERFNWSGSVDSDDRPSGMQRYVREIESQTKTEQTEDDL